MLCGFVLFCFCLIGLLFLFVYDLVLRLLVQLGSASSLLVSVLGYFGGFGLSCFLLLGLLMVGWCFWNWLFYCYIGCVVVLPFAFGVVDYCVDLLGCLCLLLLVFVCLGGLFC